MTTERIGTLTRLSDTPLTVAGDEIDIRGRTVKDGSGDDVGKVDDLLLDDTEGKVRFMEVSSGGFLGMGKSKVMIPIDAIQSITEDEVRISQGREHVAGAPDYDPDLIPDAAQQYWTNLYGYYGYPPYWSAGYMYPSYPRYPFPR